MPRTTNQVREQIRRSRRPSSGSTSFSSSGRDDNLEDEDYEEPPRRSAAIRAAPSRDDLPNPEDLADEIAADIEQGNTSPSGRMAEVRNTPYYGEYKLRMIARLIMRGIPLDKIAQAMGISLANAYRERDLLFSELRKAAQNLDGNQIIGEGLSFYNEISAMALRIATDTNNSLAARISGMRTALNAKGDAAKFLQVSGVFDVLRFKAKSSKDSGDIQNLMEMTKRMLSTDEREENPDLPDEAFDPNAEDIHIL